MSEPHRIRLRGPWDVEPLSPAMPALRVSLPTTLRNGGLAGYAGLVRFVRRFGRPTNLSVGDTVWLVFEGVSGAAEVHLNDRDLGRVVGTGRFEVGDLLAERNAIAVTVEAADDSAGIVGDVVLEIRTPG